MENRVNEIKGTTEKQETYAKDLYTDTYNTLEKLIDMPKGGTQDDKIQKESAIEIAEFVMGKLNEDLEAHRIIEFVKRFYDKYTIMEKIDMKIHKKGGHYIYL